jgi:hypothetical protein
MKLYKTRVRVRVFNATSNIISAILWLSVLLVEETGVPSENQRPEVTYKLYHILFYWVHLAVNSKSQH